jgi:SAM-dependent methyltransferase
VSLSLDSWVGGTMCATRAVPLNGHTQKQRAADVRLAEHRALMAARSAARHHDNTHTVSSNNANFNNNPTSTLSPLLSPSTSSNEATGINNDPPMLIVPTSSSSASLSNSSLLLSTSSSTGDTSAAIQTSTTPTMVRGAIMSDLVTCNHPTSARHRCMDCIQKAIPTPSRFGATYDIAAASLFYSLFHHPTTNFSLSTTPSASNDNSTSGSSSSSSGATVVADLKTAHSLSHHDKALIATRTGMDQRVLRYGEIEYWSFVSILQRSLPRTGERFYDLGSGTGRAVLVASLMQLFSATVGIELLPSLHHAAHHNSQLLSHRYPSFIPSPTSTTTLSGHHSDATPSLSSMMKGIQFVNDDFFNVDWSSGDVVFIASTAFPPPLMTRIADAALLLKTGSRIITLSVPLPTSPTNATGVAPFRVVAQDKYRMSWGNVTVFWQIRQ